MRLRKLIFNVHLWTGLTVGLLLVVAGLTGSILVFGPEIDARLNPGLLRTSPTPERASLQAIVKAVATEYPQHPVSYIRMPRGPNETYEITTAGADPLEVFADPYRGTILGARRTADGFVNVLHELHVHLLSGETGEQVMGFVGLLALLLVMSGGIVWWPGIRRWWEGFTLRWRASWKRINFDLHRVGGIWSAAFLLLTAGTGAALVFHDAFLAGANWLTASPASAPSPTVVPRPGEPTVSLDMLLRRADQALPEGVTTYVSFPASPDMPLTVRKHLDVELHPNGRSFVHIDPWSGQVLAVERATLAPAGLRALNLLYPLHIGSYGGLPIRLLYAILGVAPLVLFVSGVLMWWNRTQAPKRRRRSQAEPTKPRTQAAATPRAVSERAAPSAGRR